MAIAKKPDRTPTPAPNPAPPELPERWGAQRKLAVVLRLVWGEPLDQASRNTQVPTRDLETWQRRFQQVGQRRLHTKQDPEERELTLAKAKLGELMMHLDILRETDRPMLKHGLQGFQGSRIVVARVDRLRPRPQFLKERFATFRCAV